MRNYTPAGPTTTHGLFLSPIPSHTQALKGQLSPVQQYVQHQLQKLETGTTAEKAEAIKGLGEGNSNISGHSSRRVQSSMATVAGNPGQPTSVAPAVDVPKYQLPISSHAHAYQPPVLFYNMPSFLRCR